MKKRIDIDYVEDIINSIFSIEKYTAGMNYDEFLKDDKTYNAVIRMFEVIGEASNKLSIELKQKNKHIPWREIIGLRNKVIHEYFGVNLKVIWTTVELELPQFKTFMLALKNELGDEE